MRETEEKLETLDRVIARGEEFIAETHVWERKSRRWSKLELPMIALCVVGAGLGLSTVIDGSASGLFGLVANLVVLRIWVKLRSKGKAHMRWIHQVREETAANVDHLKAARIEFAETGEWVEWMSQGLRFGKRLVE